MIALCQIATLGYKYRVERKNEIYFINIARYIVPVDWVKIFN